MITRHDCVALDAEDALAPLRDQFDLPAGVIYLDGNSLGVLPKATAARIQQVVHDEWGRDLIRSWNSAGWMTLSARIGDKIAQLVGAGPGEIVVGDSTSVNLYKVLSAALALARADAPQRRVIVSERSNFPTDLYIADSLARERGFTLKLIEPGEVVAALHPDVALLMLTHVNYRSGRMHDMAAITRAAHAAGALVVWDLAHSAGAVPVNLKGSGPIEAGADFKGGNREAADFAVGCGYKYLNGGPGAPAFVWAHPRHTARMDREQLCQPLSGWLGHAAPFEFSTAYRPAPGIQRFVCGTPPVLSLAALECGVDGFIAAQAHGGMAALRRKSLTLTDLFIHLVESRCTGQGLSLITPRDGAQRGSQASFAHENGYPLMQALIARGVIGDFRAGDPGSAADREGILRFGFTPLYTRFVDVWDGVEHLVQVLASGEWREPRFGQRAAVT
jgi:kynureninase